MAANYLDENGDYVGGPTPIDDPNQDMPAPVDASAQAPAPAPAPLPPPAPDPNTPGSGIPWNPGATQPSSAPPGYHWDASMAAFEPDAPAAAASPSFDAGSWVSGQLAAAQSTDDPNYWIGKIGSDPNVQNPATRDSALNYWAGRIAQGDGALAVRQGTMQKFNDSQPAAAAAPAQAAAAPAVNGPNTASTASQIAMYFGPTTTPYQNELRDIIRQRLAAASAPVDENATGIGDAVTAARDEGTRATQDERTALAERLYANGGLNTNELTQGIQQSAEKQAANVGGLRATLIRQEYARKQSELDTLLSLATQSGDAEATRQIQQQMAALDAALRAEGLAQNQSQFDTSTGVNLAEFGANLNQQAALAGLNG